MTAFFGYPLVHDRVAKDADLVELNLDRVAFLHKHLRIAVASDAAGSAGNDHVAGDKFGYRGQVVDQRGMLNSRSSVVARCISSPLRRVIRVRAPGSGISSAVTIHGPKAPDL